MCFYYDSYCEVYTESVRKARKPHRCDGCGATIHPGTFYTSSSGIFEGEPFSGATCGSCELTRFRIHLQELHEGCEWRESWIAPEDIGDYCTDTEFERSSQADGQWHLNREYEREKEQRREWRAAKQLAAT